MGSYIAPQITMDENDNKTKLVNNNVVLRSSYQIISYTTFIVPDLCKKNIYSYLSLLPSLVVLSVCQQRIQQQ
jgi:hypothetical protein